MTCRPATRRRPLMLTAVVALLAAMIGGCDDTDQTGEEGGGSAASASPAADADRYAADWSQFQANPRRTGTLETEGVPDMNGVKWKYRTGGRLRGGAVVADGVVYVGGTDDVLHAVDADTGEAKWTTEIGFINSAAAVYGEHVYVSVGGFGNLYAVDKATGEVDWSASIGFVGAATPRPPAVVDGTVYLSNGDQSVYAFDADTGEQHWRQDLGERRLSMPAVGEEYVHVAPSDVATVALERGSGEAVWRSGIETGASGNGPTLTHSSLIMSPGAPTKVFEFKKQNGNRIQAWPGDDGLTTTSTAVTDERVFVGRATNRLYAYSRSSGNEIWRYQAGHSVFGAPAVVGETVYVTSADGVVHAVDRASGEGRWQFDTGKEGLMPGVAVSGGVVYVAAPNGSLYALH